MRKVMLIRHPEIEGAKLFKYFGITDVALSKQGYKQAECLAGFLSHQPVKTVYSSHLQRAKYTAQLIADKFGLSLNVTPELREIDFGRWEGNSYQEMIDDDERLYQAWLDMSPEFCFPEGESLGEFYHRVTKEYKRILADNADTQDEELIVIVSHGGVIKLLLADMLGIEWGKVNSIKQDFGALNIIEHQNGYNVLQRMNDTCYLAGKPAFIQGLL